MLWKKEVEDLQLMTSSCHPPKIHLSASHKAQHSEVCNKKLSDVVGRCNIQSKANNENHCHINTWECNKCLRIIISEDNNEECLPSNFGVCSSKRKYLNVSVALHLGQCAYLIGCVAGIFPISAQELSAFHTFH